MDLIELNIIPTVRVSYYTARRCVINILANTRSHINFLSISGPGVEQATL